MIKIEKIEIKIGSLPRSLERIRPKEKLPVSKEFVFRPEDLRSKAVRVLEEYNFFMEQIPLKFTEKMSGRIGPCYSTSFTDLKEERGIDFVRAVLFSEPPDDVTKDIRKNPREYLDNSDIFLFLAHSSSLEKSAGSFPENPDMLVKIETNNDISIHTKGLAGFKKAESGEITDFYFLLGYISKPI